MMGSMTLDDLIKIVRRKFRDGPPNGWILGWDAFRCFQPVSAAARPYRVNNHTSFDYGFCNWFEVRIDRDNSDSFWLLTVKLSFVAPTYCMFWTEYESRRGGAVIHSAPGGYGFVESRVRDAVERNGFVELPKEWHDRPVDGIELELSDPESVTLDKCLFTDFAEPGEFFDESDEC